MKEEYYTDRVTLLDDGTYRWYYDMDMYRNKSMLYTLEKVNLLMFLGISVGGALLIWFAEGDASFAGRVMLFGMGAAALMALLYVVGFYIAALFKQGKNRMHFLMREEGIKLIPANLWGKAYETERNVRAAGDPTVGYKSRYGRVPRITLVRNLIFSEVTSCKSYPKWGMIDISRPGGRFQVYVGCDDFKFVEQYILDHVPERARKAHK